MACTSASACTAVGWSSAGTLAERWDGTRWTIQATPNPPQGAGVLSGVACMSASACTAVGATNFTPGAKTLAERWDGTRWSIQPTPNPPQGGGVLASVACTSLSACTPAGWSNAGNLAERWNGTTWSIQPTPSPPGHAAKLLAGVACTSQSSRMAVGNEFDPATGNSLGTLAERWDGRTWRIVPTFKPAPAGPGAALYGVACTSASACTAVGNQTLARTLAERWNGRTWQVQPTPNPAGAQNITLASVACPARTACTAFGLNHIGSGAPVRQCPQPQGAVERDSMGLGLADHERQKVAGAVPVEPACAAVARRGARQQVDYVFAADVERGGAGDLLSPGVAPALSALLPAFPGTTWIRLPTASPARCDRPKAQVFHSPRTPGAFHGALK